MIFLVVKFLSLIFLYMVTNLVYLLIFKPYMARKRYSKYKNVTMADKFYPIAGEAKLFEENSKLRKPNLHHYYMDAVSKGSSVDLRLTQYGPIQKIDVLSVKALNEFEKLVPHKIDREGDRKTVVTRLMGGSFSFLKSNK